MAYLSTVGTLIRSSWKVEEEGRSRVILNNFALNAPPEARPNMSIPVTLRQNEVIPTANEVSTNLKSLPDNFVPKVYRSGPWDNAPIVVEEYNLLFFTQGKVRTIFNHR